MTARAPVSQQPLFVACYDISDNRERRRLDKLLCGYGFRTQKSVFECHLGKSQKQQLVAAVERLALRSGQLRLYRVYADAGAQAIGKAVKSDLITYAFTI